MASESTHPATAPRQVPMALAVLGVLFASICFGTVPFFSRSLTAEGMAPHAVAFYRYVLAAVLLLPALFAARAGWREICWGIAAGAVMGMGWVGYVTALETVPASTVGVLYMTYPVFTVLIAWALFGDAPTRRALFAAVLIIFAAAVAGSPAAVPMAHMPAILISLAAPLGFGFGICVLVYRLSRIAPLARVGSVSLGAMLGLLPLVLTSEVQEIVPATPGGWGLILGIALVTAFVPQLIYTICSPIVGASRSAVIGSVELPTMFAVGVLAFGEAITIPQAVACALVITAMVLSRSRVTRGVATTMAKS